MRPALTLAALALLPAAALAQTPSLTISVYGIAQDDYAAALYKPFEAQCGCKLVIETGNSSERAAKLEANAAKPIIDVIALSDTDALEAARKGLLQALDPVQIPNITQLYDFAQDPIGDGMAVGYTFYGTSIVYRSDVTTVDSWLDLFSDDLKGRVALPNITTTQGPITMFMLEKALGSDDPSLSAAIALVAEHKNDIVTFYERGSQIPQLLQQEEILAAPVGRFGWANLRKIDMPIAWAAPTEGQGGGMNVLAMVAGSSQPELAAQFIDYWLSTEVQQKLALALVDSPVNTNVEVPDDIAESLTFGAETAASIHFLPPAIQVEHREDWLNSWNNQVAR